MGKRRNPYARLRMPRTSWMRLQEAEDKVKRARRTLANAEEELRQARKQAASGSTIFIPEERRREQEATSG